MYRFLLILVALLLLAGCERTPEPAPSAKKGGAPASGSSGDDRRVQVRIGDRDPDEGRELPFDILTVHSNQIPMSAAPWHADGGDWTFFDCSTASPRPAKFIVGVRSRSNQGEPAAWGEATIVASDRAEGQKLLDCLGTAFNEKVPTARESQPLEQWNFNTAVLGEGLNRETGGGFSGQGGTWSATKWFLERDGFSAEVYFNYNLQDNKGEFSEKDPEYREDLLAVLAIVLRDGPRPERTPQTDPNLTDIGPTFGNGQRIAKDVRLFQFGPGGKRIIYATRSQDGSTVASTVFPDRPDQPAEVARVSQELMAVTAVDPDLNELLVLESLPKKKGQFSSDDEQRLWWVDRTKKETRELTGPWERKNFLLPSTPVSPDGRFIAITSWQPRTDGKPGNYSVIHVYDRQARAAHTIKMPNQSIEQVGWVNTDNNLRLVFLTGDRRDKDQKKEWFLGEPETGKYAPSEKSPLMTDEGGQRLSPDGRLAASVEGTESLTITDVKTNAKRSFKFHEDDRRYVTEDGFQWVSPRYLRLDLGRLAFLDIQTLKMSYPLATKDPSAGHTFSPDFKWVVWQKPEDGLYVSPVVVPDR